MKVPLCVVQQGWNEQPITCLVADAKATKPGPMGKIDKPRLAEDCPYDPPTGRSCACWIRVRVEFSP